jgi:hypothetical protein
MSQTITFNTLPNEPLGTPPFTVSASTSSGLPVSFASLTIVDEYDFRLKQIAECDSKLEAYLSVLPTRPSPGADTGAVPPAPADATGKKNKREKKYKATRRVRSTWRRS